MTDPNQKTLVDLKPYGAAPAGDADDTVRDLNTVAAPARERDGFDPYKFQSHPMPPGLRAEILEQAGQRAPGGKDEEQRTSAATEGSVVVDDETQRVADTVLIKRVVRRRFRRRALAVGVFFGSLGAALAVWTRDTQPPAAVRSASQPPQPLPASVLPQVPPPVVAKTRAPDARAESALGAAPSSSQLASQPMPASAPPPLAKPPSTRRAAAPRRALASVKPSASNTSATGTDLLDFEGPAPK